MLVPATIAQRVVRRVGGAKAPDPPKEVLTVLRDRLRALFERDLENVKNGMYPRRLLFSVPVRSYAKSLPKLVLDLPRSMRRRREEAWRDLPDEVDTELYPPYFRRTFHWQTDGYLSRRSAEIYDCPRSSISMVATSGIKRRSVPLSRCNAERE